MSRLSRLSRGFTLIELMVVVAIVGILATMAMPMVELARVRANEAELRTALRQIRTALDDYRKAWDEGRIEKKTGASGYPPSLDELVNGVRDVNQPNESEDLLPASPAARSFQCGHERGKGKPIADAGNQRSRPESFPGKGGDGSSPGKTGGSRLPGDCSL